MVYRFFYLKNLPNSLTCTRLASQVCGEHGAAGRFPRLPDRGLQVYECVAQAFEWLPLGAVVQGTVLVLHGGIGSQGRHPTSRRHSVGQAAPEPGPRWGVCVGGVAAAPLFEPRTPHARAARTDT